MENRARSVSVLSGVMKSGVFFFFLCWALQGFSSLAETEAERLVDKHTHTRTHTCMHCENCTRSYNFPSGVMQMSIMSVEAGKI